MNPSPIHASDSDAQKAPAVWTIGEPSILSRPLVAVVCSTRIPPDLVLPALDCIRELRKTGTCLVGGFQSPLERAAYDLALLGDSPIALCPARSLDRFRPTRAERAALDDGRLLIVSPFRSRRTDAASAERRNRMVVALSARVLILHARAGSRAEATARHAVASGVPVYFLEHDANQDLELLGGRRWGEQTEPPA